MAEFDESKNRDMILFVGSYLDVQRKAMQKLDKMFGRPLQALVIVDGADSKSLKIPKVLSTDTKVIVVVADFSSTMALQKAVMPYKERLLAVTCRAEKNIPLLKKIIPHIPYVNSPTELSLDWTTDKIRMRQMLRNYDKSISPKFAVVHDATQETLDRIERTVGFPLIIKPSGLAASLLVTICYHREELEANLKNTVRKINRIYKERKGRGEPQILVEEFMEGVMYSIDAYVNQRGFIYYTPLVHVRTGRTVGYEDFFGYMRITPVNLKPHKIDDAKKAAEKAIEALNMRSTTCHVELMKTEDGWKIIELGPRVGGFRHEMYELSYGIDHTLNDILIRIPKKPIIAKKAKGYTAVMQFYAKRKGKLVSINGVNKVRKLESFKRIDVIKKIGDMCDFARNGDSPVFTIVLFNQNRPKLLADIRRLEQSTRINVAVPTRKTTKIVTPPLLQ
jgi:biotin carboxylase